MLNPEDAVPSVPLPVTVEGDEGRIQANKGKDCIGVKQMNFDGDAITFVDKTV